MRPLVLLWLLALILIAPAAHATCQRDAMIVFDGSGSMSEMGFNQLGEPRIFEARRAMRNSIPEIAALRRLGLVIYGPGRRNACLNIDLRFPPISDAAPRILAEIEALRPTGKTPLTNAIREAAHVLDFRNRPGIIVLITDGKETCGGAPCRLAAELAAEAHDLTVHVIGFKVRGDHFSWDDNNDYLDATTVASCLAEETGGRYFRAETVEELADALKESLGCPFVALND